MNAATTPVRTVWPVFLLIVLAGPVVLGPILNLALAPLGIPFHRAMSRALLISALGALVLFRHRLHLRTWWETGPQTRRNLALGLGLATVSALAMILLFGIFCGFGAAHVSPGQAALRLATAAVACLIVPVLEETLFRGFLVTLLVEAAGRRAGWLLAALIYAVVHFLRFPSIKGDHVWSGAAAMGWALANLGHGEFAGGSGLNLFLVGLILGGVFLRSGTLWPGAALHGGWIFILMIFSAFTRPIQPPRFAHLGDGLLSSPLTSGVLVLLGLALWRFYRPGTKKPPEPGEPDSRRRFWRNAG